MSIATISVKENIILKSLLTPHGLGSQQELIVAVVEPVGSLEGYGTAATSVEIAVLVNGGEANSIVVGEAIPATEQKP